MGTVSLFFDRNCQGFSEPGTCPRCKRAVNVGGKGSPKAHKCCHLVWCKQCPKCNSAVAEAFQGEEQ